jgi:hypothetical protein
MGQLLLKGLFLASLYLLDLVGLGDLYQLYCDVLTAICAYRRRNEPLPPREADSVQPYR